MSGHELRYTDASCPSSFLVGCARSRPTGEWPDTLPGVYGAHEGQFGRGPIGSSLLMRSRVASCAVLLALVLIICWPLFTTRPCESEEGVARAFQARGRGPERAALLD